MPSTSIPQALSFASPFAFISHLLLTYPSVPIKLVVCSERADFLSSAQKGQQTIAQLAAAKSVQVAFAGSVPHLRALLTTFGRSGAEGKEVRAVWGLVALHVHSAEFSAGGIGRTVAAAVDAGVAVFGEGCHYYRAEVEEGGDGGGEDEEMERDREEQDEPGDELECGWWIDVEVPLLSVGDRGGKIVGGRGRTVGARAVLGRWCLVGEPETDEGMV
jgi:hypothetical protein